MRYARITVIAATTWLLMKILAGDASCAGMVATVCESRRVAVVVVVLVVIFVVGVLRILRWRREE